MTRLIPLTHGKTASVDDCDHDALTRYSWFAVECNGSWYAGRKATVDGKQTTIYMHRQIMGASDLPLVDHINRNGLDNQRHNLRFATRAQNMANTGKQRRNTTGFRGVVWCERLRKYRAAIGFEYRKIMLGTFQHKEDAARAYDAKAVELFGDFAVLNFPAQ